MSLVQVASRSICQVKYVVNIANAPSLFYADWIKVKCPTWHDGNKER